MTRAQDPSVAPGIHFQGLNVRFHEGPLLGPWAGTCGAGVHLVTGPSGSGKTTLIHALAGLLPTLRPATVSGMFQVAGRDPRDLAPAERPTTVGLAFQDVRTVAPTPWEEVAFPLEQAGLPGAETRRRVEAMLDRFRLTDLADQDLSRLSGGQRARTQLAAVLAPDPDVVLLDEPTPNLDAAGRRVLHDLAQEAMRNGDRTWLVATHHPETWPGAQPTIHLPAPLPPPSTPRPSPSTPRPWPGEGRRTTARLQGTLPRTGQELDLTLHAGDAVAVTGANGGGKSTLLWTLAGLLRPAAGRVRVAGDDPATLHGTDRARRIGLCFQDPGWHITQDTVLQEATWTLGLLGRDLAAAETWLDRFGLGDLRHRHPWDLSGGQRQRLAIVTALAHDPDLLLLDEPTRGLDGAGRTTLLAVLRERSAAGRTTLVATHDEALITALPRRLFLEAP